MKNIDCQNILKVLEDVREEALCEKDAPSKLASLEISNAVQEKKQEHFKLIEGVKKIPLFGSIAAGNPIIAMENILDYFSIPANISGDFVLSVVGDSMEPLLKNGSYVVVSKGDVINSGAVGVFIVDGEAAVVKRIFYDNYGVVLKSENPEYAPVFISGERWKNECKVVGKVTMFMQRLVY